MNTKDRAMNYLLLLSAIALSSVAAYYSIAGLIAIFAAAVIPIAVMGSILEVSKLVVTSWLYRNWEETPKLMKAYFCSAIAILMLLTSMGIFGFLSKAHLDQNLVSGDVTSKLAIIEEQIKIEKETIDANRKIITQLDSQVDQLLSRSTTDAGADRSAGLRRSQAKERKQAQEAILSAQAKVGKLNAEKAPIAAEVRKVEAEVGPIKYIAQLIYGQEASDQDTLEKAVRWVIIMIVVVFDPLAVLMFIAFNQTTMNHKRIIKPLNESHVIHDEVPKEIVSHTIQEEVVNTEPLKEKEPEQSPAPIHTPIQKKEYERDRVLTPVKPEADDPNIIYTTKY